MSTQRSTVDGRTVSLEVRNSDGSTMEVRPVEYGTYLSVRLNDVAVRSGGVWLNPADQSVLAAFLEEYRR